MWTKKADDELKADRQALARQKWWAGVALVIFVCSVALPRSILAAGPGVRIVAAVASGLFILGWNWRLRWRRARANVRICERCNSVEPFESKGACECGGKLVPLSHLKWVEALALSLPAAMARLN